MQLSGRQQVAKPGTHGKEVLSSKEEFIQSFISKVITPAGAVQYWQRYWKVFHADSCRFATQFLQHNHNVV